MTVIEAQKPVILVVDDDDDYLLAMERRLIRSGYKVVSTSNPDETLEALEKYQPDIAMIDMILGEKSGREICRSIRAIPSFEYLPIMIYSGYDLSQADRDTVSDFGANLFVQRPFDWPEVAVQIEQLLKKSQFELKDMHRRLHIVIENSVDGLMVVNPEGVIRFVNPVAQHLFARSKESLVGQVFGLPLVGDGAVEIELVPLGRDLVIVEMRTTQIDWIHEKCSLVNLHDVTESKRVESELLQLNTQLAKRNQELLALFDISMDLANTLELKQLYKIIYDRIAVEILGSTVSAVFIIDKDAQVLKCLSCTIDGTEIADTHELSRSLNAEQLSNLMEIDSVHITHVSPDFPNLIEAFGQGDTSTSEPLFNIEIPMIFADETRGFLVFHISESLNESVNKNLLTTIAREVGITLQNALLYQEVNHYVERLNELVEERTNQLQIVNKQLEIILQNVTNAIILLESDGKIRMVNAGFEKIFGYSGDASLGKHLTSLVSALDRITILETLANADLSTKTQRRQVSCEREDKSTFDAEITFSVVSDANQIVCTIFDISHFKKVESIQDHFISMINHELRTPITSISVASETLLRYYDRLSHEKRIDRIERIHYQAQNMIELVTTLLEISKLEATIETREIKSVDMVQIVEQVIRNLDPNLTKKQQVVNVICELDQIIIDGNQADFYRIWQNLIGNASKYTQDGGQIDVVLQVEKTRIAEQGDEIEMFVGKVQDNGPGIPIEDRGSLFTRFFRGWAEVTSISGTGLGLFLVKQTLDMYQGSITCESIVGKGTTFNFQFPTKHNFS